MEKNQIVLLVAQVIEQHLEVVVQERYLLGTFTHLLTPWYLTQTHLITNNSSSNDVTVKPLHSEGTVENYTSSLSSQDSVSSVSSVKSIGIRYQPRYLLFFLSAYSLILISVGGSNSRAKRTQSKQVLQDLDSNVMISSAIGSSHLLPTLSITSSFIHSQKIAVKK